MKTKNLAEAASLLREGGIVAFPTETVYGLGARLFCEEAIGEVFRLKGRPSDNPLIVHIAHLDMLELVSSEVSEKARRLVNAFMPGPLSLVLPKRERVPLVATGGLETIAVRMPDHPIALELIRRVGEPLVAPSANLSGRPSSTTAEHVREDFGGRLAAIVDGGACTLGIESTVVTLVPKPCILRPGAVSKEAIEEVLGKKVSSATAETPLASPGMKYRHYAPQARIRLFESGEELAQALKREPSRTRMVLHSVTAQTLYDSFRTADAEGYAEVFILCTPEMRRNPALMDRLLRAGSLYPKKN